MIVQSAYCPHCRAVTNLTEQITFRNKPKADKETDMLITRSYHCESCNSFVRSEEDEPISRDAIKELF